MSHLQTLPTDPHQRVRVVGRVRQVAGRTLLMLPLRAPFGSSRGQRLRVAIGDAPTTVRVALVVAGQLALPLDQPAAAANGCVPVTIQPLPRRRTRGIPHDLASALAAAGLDLADLPVHEIDQLLLLIGESASSEVRAARVAAAVAAIEARRARGT